MNWLVSILNDVELSLPPILSNDPIIAWVWSYISSLYNVSNLLHVKIDVVNALCSLAIDNNRNKEIIVHEGGVTPLLKLMKEDSSPEAQISTANTLFHLVNNQIRSRLVTNELGVPIIANCFQKSSTRVQISVARLIATMAENDEVSQEAFARENMIRMLVSLLSFETFVGNEIQSVIHLWRLISILFIPQLGRLIAKLIETETGELQTNCLVTVMEITNAAESNVDLRRSAFKTNSPAAKAVVEQLLRLINNSENSEITISAIRSLGSLARSFPARETHVIVPLVKQLGHNNHEVGTESAIALTKFVSPENFLCTEHSKTIIEFDGVKALMKLLRVNERTQYHSLVDLCYLAIHSSKSEVLVKAGVLTALEGVDKSIVGQHSQLKELVIQAIYHLYMYHTEVQSQRF
ncbi:uncharacterized protein [Rutidosis leptorrhynchoides]|uniref:uncharacterized protein n=1 Tax=Rutidosis leptorrhynchoides TaxID=125765 RepID=UPI003A991750